MVGSKPGNEERMARAERGDQANPPINPVYTPNWAQNRPSYVFFAGFFVWCMNSVVHRAH
jgi:hypothetical protein